MKRFLPEYFSTILSASLIFFVFFGPGPFTSLAFAAAKGAIKVVSPPDKSLVTVDKLFLAGVVKGPAANEISIKGVKVTTKKGIVKVESGAFGSLITLKKGMNEITLKAGSLTTQIKVFYQPDNTSKKSPPAGFMPFFVHQNPEILDCKDCHRLRRDKFNYKKIIPAKASCATTDCHPNFANEKHVHGPIGAGVCISCHNPHGSYFPLQLARSGGDLCFVCHENKRQEFNSKVVHAPLEEGCLDCHDPHQSQRRFQLKGKEGAVSTLCYTCHEDSIFTKEHQHGPVGVGDCIACHNPHASEHENLLLAPTAKGEACFICHQDRQEDFNKKQVHAPVADDCSVCHDPHSEANLFQLYEPENEMCASCHQEINKSVYDDIKNARYPHKPVDEGRCTDCHSAHSSDATPLLKNFPEQLCGNCHDELADHMKESSYKHGPVQTGDCAACHKVHGSEFAKLLIRYFPPDFYSEYEVENYALCFGCHNQDVAKKKYTTKLTNFRDNNYNLHYFHVNMEKGRTCTACHDAHASSQPRHVRLEVPFGAWSYPIQLTKTETGGTCVVGCHAPKSYDRKKAKLNQGT